MTNSTLDHAAAVPADPLAARLDRAAPSNPVMAAALAQVRAFLGLQHSQLCRTEEFLREQLTSFGGEALPAPAPAAPRPPLMGAEELAASISVAPAGDLDAEIARRDRAIAALQAELDHINKSHHDAEVQLLEQLKAKEHDLNMVSARRKGSNFFQELERKYALELAHLQLLIGQKEQQIQELEGRLLEAAQARLQVEQHDKRIQELMSTIEQLQKWAQERETSFLDSLRSKDEELRIATSSGKEKGKLEALARQYAHEAAELQKMVVQKEEEKQQAIEPYRLQADQAQSNLIAAQERLAELEARSRLQEMQQGREIDELRQEVKTLRERADTDDTHVPERDISFLRELLAECPLFKNCTRFELSLLAGLTNSEQVDEGDLIMKENTPADSLYIIVEGSVTLSRTTRGESQEVLSLEPADIFGEGSLIRDRKREATAVANAHTRLLRVRYEDYRELAQSNLPLAKKLPANLLRIVNERTFLYH